MVQRIINFFLPKERKFYELLLKASQNSLLAARKLHELMKDFSSLDEKQLVLLSDKIHEIENKGDEITHEISHELYKTFITPIDREDIHELAQLIDDQADLIDSLTKKITYYNVKNIDEFMLKQIDIAVRQMEFLTTAIEKMESNGSIEEQRNKVLDLEDEADVVHRKAISSLFSDSMPPLDVIKMKDLYETLEILTDKNQRVAITIESIVIKHA
ncbi:MAG: DUF47 family protein [Candidatus Micrarchaeota archaeon]